MTLFAYLANYQSNDENKKSFVLHLPLGNNLQINFGSARVLQLSGSMKSNFLKNNRSAATFASTIPPVPIVNIESTVWDSEIGEEERNAFYMNEDRSLGEDLFQRGLRSSEFPYSLDLIR